MGRRSTGTRAWLELRDGETAPEVLEGDRPHRLAWSSLWPDRPDDRIEFSLRPDGQGTHLAIVVTSDEEPGPERAAEICHRRDRLIYGEFRLSHGWSGAG